VIISHFYSPARMKLLHSRGVDSYSVLRGKEKFDLDEFVTKISTNIAGMRSKTVGTASQLKALERIFENPFRSNYTLAITSWPSDLRAKQVAVSLMSRAMFLQNSTKSKVLLARRLPLWYRIYGGFECGLRDKPEEAPPSLLVLSNVAENSTNSKIEKIRDLLERYSEIPRVVVIGGSTDPLTFFATKLFYPLKMGLFLGPETKQREIVL